MELSQELMVDIALNVVGYLAAAGLAAIIFSLGRGNRTNTGSAAASSSNGVSYSEFGNPESVQMSGAPTFVQFGQFDKTSSDKTATAGGNKKPDNSRRDRVSIVRTARMMLKAGASSEKIKRVLPISEAELAFLSAGQYK